MGFNQVDNDWEASVVHTESLYLPLYPTYIFVHTVVLGNDKPQEEKQQSQRQ